MNSCIKSIRAAACSGWFNLKTLPIAFSVLVISGAVCSAAFRENFQDDTVGLPPTPLWTIGGANGTTATGNVATDGANKFLALRDFASGTDVTARRSDFGGGLYEAAGYLQFDIRFNQGIDSSFGIELFASKFGVCA